ncbi:MAG: TauD/TfdA family dioxygenase [Myxococcota bacterium]|nr:TauD/TfdA family dioxygenase [Myxococcota bacterium]
MQVLNERCCPGARHVVRGVRASGVAWLRGYHSDAQLLAIARDLGRIVGDTSVRVRPGSRTYLASPGPIPVHTDHSRADLIGWRCEAQDDHVGASRLVDGHEVLGRLSAETIAQLERTRLPAMVRLGDPATLTPVVSRRGGCLALFHAPWLAPVDATPEGRRALRSLRAALGEAERRALEIRLAPGELLFVDNRRILHGRAALSDCSPRRLRRLWIETTREPGLEG